LVAAQLMGIPFGGCGSVVGTPFSSPSGAILDSPLCHSRYANARCADVVRMLVVRNARCAGVVRMLVVRNARGAGVIRRRVVRMARRAARDRVLRVIPPNARRAGVVPCGA